MSKRGGDLSCQMIVKRIDRAADVVGDVARMQSDFAAVARIKNVLDVQQDVGAQKIHSHIFFLIIALSVNQRLRCRMVVL